MDPPALPHILRNGSPPMEISAHSNTHARSLNGLRRLVVMESRRKPDKAKQQKAYISLTMLFSYDDMGMSYNLVTPKWLVPFWFAL